MGQYFPRAPPACDPGSPMDVGQHFNRGIYMSTTLSINRTFHFDSLLVVATTCTVILVLFVLVYKFLVPTTAVSCASSTLERSVEATSTPTSTHHRVSRVRKPCTQTHWFKRRRRHLRRRALFRPMVSSP